MDLNPKIKIQMNIVPTDIHYFDQIASDCVFPTHLLYICEWERNWRFPDYLTEQHPLR